MLTAAVPPGAQQIPNQLSVGRAAPHLLALWASLHRRWGDVGVNPYLLCFPNKFSAETRKETGGDFNFEAVTKVISAKAAWRHALNTFRSDSRWLPVSGAFRGSPSKPCSRGSRLCSRLCSRGCVPLGSWLHGEYYIYFFSVSSSTELVPSYFFLYEGISDEMQLLQQCGNIVIEPYFAPQRFLTVWES